VVTRPPCASMLVLQMLSPIPMPRFFVVKKGSNNLASFYLQKPQL
jgi:hypothetical protein